MKTQDFRAAARAWWRVMQPSLDDGRSNPVADRAALAQLRRSSGVADMLGHEAVFDLYRRCGFVRDDVAYRLPWVAAAALVLAHVRQSRSGGRRLAAVVGRRSFDDELSAPMSALRFRRLMAAREPDDLVRHLRRAVALAGRDTAIDVGVLAADILAWPHPEAGAKVRTRWAFDYHAAGDAAPADTTPADAATEDAVPSPEMS